jgi:hypothetical protein
MTRINKMDPGGFGDLKNMDIDPNSSADVNRVISIVETYKKEGGDVIPLAEIQFLDKYLDRAMNSTNRIGLNQRAAILNIFSIAQRLLEDMPSEMTNQILRKAQIMAQRVTSTRQLTGSSLKKIGGLASRSCTGNALGIVFPKFQRSVKALGCSDGMEEQNDMMPCPALARSYLTVVNIVIILATIQAWRMSSTAKSGVATSMGRIALIILLLIVGSIFPILPTLFLAYSVIKKT